MKRFTLLFSLILLAGTILIAGCKKQEPEPAQKPTTRVIENKEAELENDKIQLAIFYAGHRKSDREKDFVAFLNKHFTRVETGDLADFNGSQSEGFDVTILDYDGDGFKSPHPTISSSFSRPIMTMGVTGAPSLRSP